MREAKIQELAATNYMLDNLKSQFADSSAGTLMSALGTFRKK
jgi:hypothetical protein